MRLMDCFSPLFAYTGYVLSGQKEVSFESFQEDVRKLLETSQEMSQKGGFSEKEYDLARFAVCAWIDESVLTSSCAWKNEWEKNELQKQYYNTHNAGVEFFEKLSFLKNGASQPLEVYCACLVMGFRGRYYSIREIVKLEEIDREVLSRVMQEVPDPFVSEDRKFFPDSYLEKEERPKRKLQWGIIPYLLIAGVIAAGVVATVFFFMYDYLDQLVELYFQTGA